MKLFDSGFIVSRSCRTEDSHRQKDLEFLAKVKAASLEELHILLKNHSHKKAPAWKKIAIQRAINKVSQSAL